MATIDVKDAAGATVAIEKPLAPGRAAAAASRPVALSTEDKAAIDALATGAKQDTGNGTLASILAKLSADPATSAGQAAIIAAIEEIPGGGGSGGDASEETLAALQEAVGEKTDAKSTATDTTSVSGISIWKQISASAQAIASAVAGTLTVATHAVTQSGSWVLSAGTALIGKVTVSDGTNDAAVRAGSSAAVAADPALVVALRPDSTKDTYAEYETVAASQTDQVLGATGAIGDYLAGVLIVPGAADCGAVSIKDGSGSAITIFAGGGTTALPTLAPIFVPLGIYATGAGWKITTGANVTAIGIGDFT